TNRPKMNQDWFSDEIILLCFTIHPFRNPIKCWHFCPQSKRHLYPLQSIEFTTLLTQNENECKMISTFVLITCIKILIIEFFVRVSSRKDKDHLFAMLVVHVMFHLHCVPHCCP